MTTARILRLFVPAGRRLALAGISAIAVASSACAGAAGSLRPGSLDVRGSAPVSDHQARGLIEGPARLLHVDVDRKREVALFRVPHQPGSPVDCGHESVAAATDGIARSGTRQINLAIGADEAICFAVRPAGGKSQQVNVSWHARAEKTTKLPVANVQIARQP
jgi:hypothetical protein